MNETIGLYNMTLSFGGLYKGPDRTNNMNPVVRCPLVLNSRRINLVSLLI